VSCDSRQVEPGGLFVALEGENRDGHTFVADALARGAVAAVVAQPVPGVRRDALIEVGDTLRALGDLAAWTRRAAALRVVAITGSAGKTTTKEMMASICRGAELPPPCSAVLSTEGNYNNLIGLPLTLLRLQGNEAVAILEMGMNRPGEIARLTEIARPDYAVVTNIGPAHLEGVGGTIAGVAAAKGELFAGLAEDAVVAVNTDDEWVSRIAAVFRGRHVPYGTRGVVQARSIRDFGGDGVAFDLWIDGCTETVRLRFVGAHNVSNALAAAALGHAMGLRIGGIASGLEQAVGIAMRMQVVRLKNGVTVINDAYNANPSSVDAGLLALRRFPGRSVVVLGEMRELGGESRRAHHQVGERAAALGIDQLYLLGPQTEAVAEGALAAGLPANRVQVCGSHAEVAAALVARWQPGDTILVKGSHSMHMEEVVRLLVSAGNST
jgi:UDP-N-acetylmuramoyl-tripeptide--D-alanyl-D-alanine ligase